MCKIPAQAWEQEVHNIISGKVTDREKYKESRPMSNDSKGFYGEKKGMFYFVAVRDRKGKSSNRFSIQGTC